MIQPTTLLLTKRFGPAACRRGLPRRCIPDKVFTIDQGDAFPTWVERLEKVSGRSGSELAGLLEALRGRHSLDHSGRNYRITAYLLPIRSRAMKPKRARSMRAPALAFRLARRRRLSFAVSCCASGELDANAGSTQQLHLGALRNTNRRRLAEFGPDTGYDSIGDWPQAEPLVRYLDQLETAGKLPKMILYNVNPVDNYVLATMIGNFQDQFDSWQVAV